MQKEAKARIKINKLLEQSGWRFFDDEKGIANLIQENARLRYEIALMRVQRAQKDMKQPVLYEQSNIRRVQTIQTTEDHRILFIKGAIDWAIQHPKETTAIAAGVTVAGLVFMWLDSKNN